MSIFRFCFVVILLGVPLAAQDAKIAVGVPITVSPEALFTHRIQTYTREASNRAAAFRANLYPTLKLGSHWFAYSAVQIHSTPYFYYAAYRPEREVKTNILQLFAAYTRSAETKSVTLKAGKLSSAFGSFPLRYDETSNPLLDLPLTYGQHVGLRADQLPCGVPDLVRQRRYKFIRFRCGGETEPEYGIRLASLYGIPGAEADFSFHHLDARLQLTNSSPAYPLSLTSEGQQAQWTAGAGYTIRQGFRIGVSAYRGPFLQQDLKTLLPAGTGLRDYPATGLGLDVQWARGRWSTNGEWNWFQFKYPAFRTSPALYSGYAEAKAILTPRLYAALRLSHQSHGRVEDTQGQRADSFQPYLQLYEFALGFHVNHFQTVKVGYEWVRTKGNAGSRHNVLGLQFVTSLNILSKVIR